MKHYKIHKDMCLEVYIFYFSFALGSKLNICTALVFVSNIFDILFNVFFFLTLMEF